MQPQHSVIIPTFDRREIVTRAVRALAAQTVAPVEVIVVVDGSTDGTAAALRRLTVPFDLRVVEQPNSGASRARNAGAELSRGELILFLDDDMMAAPDLLEVLAREHAAGADAVFGHIPIASGAPRGFLARGLGEWAVRRRERLIAAGGSLRSDDLLTGQLSVRRAVFEALGGFDERFTRDGSFGMEDTDFGRRLFGAGCSVVFAADAVSEQHYAVTPRMYLRQWHESGRAAVAYVRKHPAEREYILNAMRVDERSTRLVIRPLSRLPGVAALAVPVRAFAVRLAERRPEGRTSERLFFKARNLEYWRGVERAGGLPKRRPVRVLCYHAVRDLSGAARIEQYGVPAGLLARQLKVLRRFGFRFVSLAEVVRLLDGSGGVPRRAVLVTFDDCYTDLLTDAVPVLRAAGAPAAAFAVAGQVGGSNEWDVRIGAPELRLLDADGLRELSAAGVEIGGHGATHRPLPTVGDDLPDETVGVIRVLAELGLPPVRAFAYPHGEHDARVRAALTGAGIPVAFTVEAGLARPDVIDALQVPRIEILRRDGGGLRFLAKVVRAGRRPRWPRRGAGRSQRGGPPASPAGP